VVQHDYVKWDATSNEKDLKKGENIPDVCRKRSTTALESPTFISKLIKSHPVPRVDQLFLFMAPQD